jgi:hypothetical protein
MESWRGFRHPYKKHNHVQNGDIQHHWQRSAMGNPGNANLLIGRL